MATIRDVAAQAGVSTATVSRVFSRPESVAPGTRDKVLAVSRMLSFEPNVTARSLALGRTQNVGFLVPDIKNPVFGSAIELMQQHARENGYSLFVAAGDRHSEDELELVQAIARQSDGLVLDAPRLSDRELGLIARTTPIVLINRTHPSLPSVNMPSGDGMARAVDHLADAGHDTITYLGGPDYSLTHHARLEAFETTCARRNVEPRLLGPFESDFAEVGEALADRIAEHGTDAVIAYNDQMAVGLMKGLARHGLHAGRDLSIVGFDNSWLSELTAPPLTTVAMPFDTAGRTALRLLFDTLAGRAVAADTIVELATTLVVRSSTRSP